MKYLHEVIAWARIYVILTGLLIVLAACLLSVIGIMGFLASIYFLSFRWCMVSIALAVVGTLVLCIADRILGGDK